MFSFTIIYIVTILSCLLICKSIYFEHYKHFKNYENIYGGLYYTNEAPHNFSLKFWILNLAPKKGIELNQIWILKCHSYLVIFGFLRNGFKSRLGTSYTIWESKHELF